MRRIDRYLIAESLPPLLFGVLLYSTLAVVSVTLPRLQWVVGTPVRELAGWLLLQLPTALVQTLPIALVLAVLLTYGRLAADNELLAFRAGGVGGRRATRAFVALGLTLAVAALALNQWVLPATNARVGSLWWELTSGGSGLFRLARQTLSVDDFTLYFRSTDRRSDDIYGVRIERWDGDRLMVLFAERGSFEDGGLRLTGYRGHTLDLAALEAAERPPEERLRRLVVADVRPRDPTGSLLLTTSESVDEIITRFSGGGFEDTRSIRDALADARDPSLPPVERRRAQVLTHRKLAEPFANLTLLLVALPLSVLYARSRSIAFGLSLVVTLAWYLLLTAGQLFAQTGVLPPWLGVWGANLILAGAGASLLGRIELR